MPRRPAALLAAALAAALAAPALAAPPRIPRVPRIQPPVPLDMTINVKYTRTVTWTATRGKQGDPCVEFVKESGTDRLILDSGTADVTGIISPARLRSLTAISKASRQNLRNIRTWELSGRASGADSDPRCGCGPTSEAGPCVPPKPAPTNRPNDCGTRVFTRQRLGIQWVRQDVDGLTPLVPNRLALTAGVVPEYRNCTARSSGDPELDFPFSVSDIPAPGRTKTIRDSVDRPCSTTRTPGETCTVAVDLKVTMVRERSRR